MKYEFFKKTSMLLNIYKSLKATVKSFLSLFPFIHFNTTYLEKKYPLQSFTKKKLMEAYTKIQKYNRNVLN